MRRGYRLSVLLLLGFGLACDSPWVRAQDNPSNLPESPSQTARSREPYSDSPSEREVSWRSLPRDDLHDHKDIWTFPALWAKGRHLAPTLAIAGVTAGLIFADPRAMPYFQKHARNLDDF